MESKREALEKLAAESRANVERTVADERKRAADDKLLAVSRIEKHAEAIIKGLDIKLRAAIDARERADKIANRSSDQLEEARTALIEQQIKASLFHKASMILRLRLAVAATRFTAQHCTRMVEVKRSLGRRLVLLEERYESDVTALKQRADAGIKRAYVVERCLLDVAKTLGLGGASASSASGAGAAMADLDGGGLGKEAAEAQRELRETQNRVYAIKAQLLEVRAELRVSRQRRSEVIGTAKFLDAEINLLGKQITSDGDVSSTEREATRIQRLHVRLEQEAGLAEKVRRHVVALEQQEAALKDERRALKMRARELEASVLGRVVKQHIAARAALHEAQLGPESLLPARIGKLPEPEPLQLKILMPRHCMDVDSFKYDLGRRDFLRARAIGRATSALKSRQAAAGPREEAASGATASATGRGDADNDDAGCPEVRILPAAVHGPHAAMARADEQRYIHDILHDPTYDKVVGRGYTTRAAAGQDETPSEIVAGLRDLTSEA